MSDPAGVGRRRRRRGVIIRKERDPVPMPLPVKTPIILGAKTPNERGSSMERASSEPAADRMPPVVSIQPREESGQPYPLSASPSHSGFTLATKDVGSQPQYVLQQKPGPVVVVTEPVSIEAKLCAPPVMKSSMRLIDEALQWCDASLDMFVEQTDFLVVGVLGSQGAGKSTVLSLLAGGNLDDPRSLCFRPQSGERAETAQQQTTGVDVFVTPERVVLLDTPPLLSAAALDALIQPPVPASSTTTMGSGAGPPPHEKKYGSEFAVSENCIEVQSLQLAAFTMTVCHVVLVVQDWFTDFELMRLLRTAEMVKPSAPSGGGLHDTVALSDEHSEHHPHVVFVQNRAGVDDLSVGMIRQMDRTIGRLFGDSRLRCRGVVSASRDAIVPALCAAAPPLPRGLATNLFLLPEASPAEEGGGGGGYAGLPSVAYLARSLRAQVLATPRLQLTQVALSERNWFHYAARTWDAVRKSTLMSEYNRLLP